MLASASFSLVSLETALEMAQDWPRGLLIGEEWPENWEELADFLQVSTINVNAKTITREEIDAVIDKGFPVLAYTVNDVEEARRLLRWGVDGVFSDAPDIIRDVLFSRH